MKIKIMFVFLISLAYLLFFQETMASYDLYVDQNNETGIETGSSDHPYNTISEATIAALEKSNSQRKIYVRSGTYEEKIVLENYTELYCKSSDKVILDGDDQSYVLKMKNHTKVKDCQIYQGKNGIEVDENAKAEIKDCKIKKTKNIGIKISSSNQKSDAQKVKIIDNKIYNGDGKGILSNKKKIEIKDNKILNNDEEGIDLHSSIKGVIENNEIENNKEGGIEFIVAKADLNIKNNILNSNKASGLAAQFYSSKPQLGEISLENNKIKNNKHYGLRCLKPAAGKFSSVDYFKNSITLDNNIFFQNAKGLFSSFCNF